MICETVADGWIGALEAMAGDLKKAGVQPMIDPKDMRPVIVLAVDEILPPRLRMTPKIAAALGTTVVVTQRYWHNKKVVEALKHDPATIEWRKRQAELEAKEQLQRANAQQAAAAPKPSEPAVLYAVPPPVAQPEPQKIETVQRARAGEDDRPLM